MTTDRLKNLGGETSGGFGVFAYYTKTDLYKNSGATSNEAGSVTAYAPNFMYNQQVSWNNTLGDDYVTKWTYSPIKYWPNEVQSYTNNPATNDGIDDQEDDKNDSNAYTDYEQGGNVSFFAYAPYVNTVTFSTKDWDLDVQSGEFMNSTDKYSEQDGVSGILKFTGNNAAEDPKVSYRLALNGNNVDLLWGTKGNTSSNVKNAFQDKEYVWETSPVAQGVGPVNTNLTKQKTNGVVDIEFKHALAKIGGTTIPYSADSKNGLMVVLDLDDMKGAEVGGQIETDATYTKTKVTIKDITITTDLDGDGKVAKTPDTNGEYAKFNGVLNLATGIWNVTSTTATAEGVNAITHIVNTTGTSGGKLKEKLDENTYDADGSTAGIQKDKDWFETADAAHTGSPGVTTVPQNVYEEEANPLVFFPYPSSEASKLKLRFKIDYVVRTFDENLHLGYSEVEQVVNKIVTFPELLMNKHYSILMHLGLTSVKFTAKVSDWDTTTGVDADGDGEIDLIQEDVYLPRNVGGLLTTWSSDKAGSKGATITVSDTKYYVDDVEKALTPTTVTSNPTGATISTPTITLPDNTTLSDRNIALTISGTEGGVTYTSNTYNVTQYGRIPESAAITWTADPTSTALTKAGQDITFTSITAVTVDGKESDATGAASATAFSSLDVSSDYALLFVDNATGKKATWISADATKITTLTNGTAANRTATLNIVSANKRIPVKSGGSNVVFTQPGA